MCLAEMLIVGQKGYSIPIPLSDVCLEVATSDYNINLISTLYK